MVPLFSTNKAIDNFARSDVCIYIMYIHSLAVLKARDNLIKIVKYLADFA